MAQVDIIGPGGPMKCAFCGRIEPDRFNGSAFFLDWGDSLHLLFACTECDGMGVLAKVRLLAIVRGIEQVWVCGPAHITGKTDAVWAEYTPVGGTA